MMHQPTDNELIAEIRLGNKDALSSLYLKYYSYLSHYGKCINNTNDIVEECIQDLFVYFFEAHERLGVIKNVKAYLFISLRRKILERLKAERKNYDSHVSLVQHTNVQFSESEIMSSHLGNLSKRENLTKALNNLPWRQREAIYLRYYNGLSTKEIAAVMGAANQTILNTIYQALQKLRSKLVVENELY